MRKLPLEAFVFDDVQTRGPGVPRALGHFGIAAGRYVQRCYSNIMARWLICPLRKGKEKEHV